jgi:hypothetical protein
MEPGQAREIHDDNCSVLHDYSGEYIDLVISRSGAWRVETLRKKKRSQASRLGMIFVISWDTFTDDLFVDINRDTEHVAFQ